MSFIGTGKTVVGAYIVYWFSKLNSKIPWKLKELKDKEKREVILYCGPSNKSVDVVAGTTIAMFPSEVANLTCA